MSPLRELRNLSSRGVERILVKAGFWLRNQSGSHRQFVGIIRGEEHRVTVMANQKSFTPGLLKSMIHQSGLSEEEWVALKKS